MFPIETKKKIALNTLLPYYRKEKSKTSQRYLAKNFIYDEKGHLICDASTLSKLENNKLCCQDEIYIALFQNLGMPIANDDTLNTLLQSANKKILQYAEHNYADKILSVIANAKKVMEPFKKYALYHEQWEIYTLLEAFYKNTTYHKESIDKYYTLFPIIPSSLQPVYITIAYQYYTRVEVEETYSFSILKKLFEASCNSITLDYLTSIYYIRLENGIKVKEYCKKILIRCHKEENTFYLSKTYNNLALIYSDTDIQESLEYLTKAILYFDYQNDILETLLIYYKNSLFLAFSSKEYDKVINLYKKIKDKDFYILKSSFVYLIYAYHKSYKDTISIQIMLHTLSTLKSQLSPFYQSLLQFFYSIYICNDKVSIQNSLKDLLTFKKDILVIEPYYLILKEILQMYTSQNHNYQLYIEFMKNFQ